MVWPDWSGGLESKLPIRGDSHPTGMDLHSYPQHAQLLAGSSPGEEWSQHKWVGGSREAAVRASGSYAPHSRRAGLHLCMTITDIFSKRTEWYVFSHHRRIPKLQKTHSSTPRTLTEIDDVLGHKATLNTLLKD